MKMGSRHLVRARELDLEAKALETADEVAGDLGLVETIKGCLSEFVVRNTFGKHVIGDDENLVAEGDGGALYPLRALRRWNLSFK